MAEKYGEVPPRFTKAWWDYFWYYYKWRVIGIVLAIFCLIFTLYQCAARPKYDMHISYVGHKFYTEEKLDLLADCLCEYIDDVDGNGEKSILGQQINFSDKNGNEEYDFASQTKLDVEMQEDCSFIFLYDKAMLDSMLNRDYADQIFLPVSEWTESMPPENMLCSKDGVAYAVSLANSKLMIENEIYHEDVYITIRQNYKNDEKNTTAWESSKKAAAALIKQN